MAGVVGDQWADNQPEPLAGIAPPNTPCDILLSVAPGSQPSALELTFTHSLLDGEDADQGRVVNAVRHAALQWGQLDLWCRAIKRCYEKSGIVGLRAQWIFEGTLRFGFGAMRPILHEWLGDKKAVRQLYRFIDDLRVLFESGNRGEGTSASNPLGAEATDWVARALEDLCAVIGQDAKTDCEKIIYKSLKLGGLEFLKDSALPLCVDLCRPSTLIDLAFHVHEDAVFPPSPLKADIITICLQEALALEARDAMDAPVVVSYSNGKRWQQVLKTVSSKKRVLDFCFTAGYSDLVARLIPDIVTEVQCDVRSEPRDIFEILPLLSTLHEGSAQKSSTQPSPYPISDLYSAIYDVALEDLCAVGQKQEQTPQVLETIKKVVAMSGGLLSLLPRVQRYKEKMDYAICEALVGIIEPYYDAIKDDEGMRSSLAALVTRHSALVPLPSRSDIQRAIHRCARMRNKPALSNIIIRALPPYKPRKYVKFSRKGSGPLRVGTLNKNFEFVLRELREAAAKSGILDHCKPLFRHIIIAWDAARGREPLLEQQRLDQLKDLVNGDWAQACKCAPSAVVREFLLADMEEYVLELQGGNAVRDHLQETISKYTTIDGSCTVKTDVSDDKVLVIVKEPCIDQRQSYDKALDGFLVVLSTDKNEQQRLLEPKGWDWVNRQRELVNQRAVIKRTGTSADAAGENRPKKKPRTTRQE